MENFPELLCLDQNQMKLWVGYAAVISFCFIGLQHCCTH